MMQLADLSLQAVQALHQWAMRCDFGIPVCGIGTGTDEPFQKLDPRHDRGCRRTAAAAAKVQCTTPERQAAERQAAAAKRDEGLRASNIADGQSAEVPKDTSKNSNRCSKLAWCSCWALCASASFAVEALWASSA
eukprot:CAMPEP_0183400606 /NCGR_PEP_ID=MMETSP0370-20130417/12705_1 /TAXON_ID=268820 /ORGANISM="Peridinium aciculiferum, Strain PAER-2" /LENGTH=134 /DNA_ID=CAMNT_0025581933 /DNA_START=121 /DNA_END=523 /DNA_ORIENTATION=+